MAVPRDIPNANILPRFAKANAFDTEYLQADLQPPEGNVTPPSGYRWGSQPWQV
jgi:hypothetical protein